MIKSIEHIQIENESQIKDTIDFLSNHLTHPLNKEIWSWEFEKNPSILFISKDKDEVIGTQFVICLHVQFYRELLLTGKTENSYFSESYRGKGLFKELFIEAENKARDLNSSMLWAFTPATKVYKNSLGFEVLDSIIYSSSLKIGIPSIKNLLQSNSLNKSILKFGNNVIKFLFFKLKKSFSKLKISLTSTSTPNSFNDVSNLYERIGLNEFVYLPLTDLLFNWRILTNPNLSYITKFFYSQDQLKGYYIIAIDKDYIANITDFIFESEDIGEYLLQSMCIDLKDHSITTLNYLGNINNIANQRVFKLLSKYGASTKLNIGMPFVYKRLDTNYLRLSKILSSDFYINGLWTEGFHY